MDVCIDAGHGAGGALGSLQQVCLYVYGCLYRCWSWSWRRARLLATGVSVCIWMSVSMLVMELAARSAPCNRCVCMYMDVCIDAGHGAGGALGSLQQVCLYVYGCLYRCW